MGRKPSPWVVSRPAGVSTRRRFPSTAVTVPSKMLDSPMNPATKRVLG